MVIKKITQQQAIKVAKEDCLNGVCFAVDLLAKMGFDCSYYWGKMAGISDVDEGDLNLKTRNELYKLLGIAEEMKCAYEKLN